MTEQMSMGIGDRGDQQDTPGDDSEERPVSVRTPLYAAYNSDRYHRQDLIRNLQTKSETRIISYVSGDHCGMEHDDAMRFGDLLHRIDKGEDIDLILQTTGGDIDAAEKLVIMIREKVDQGAFRVIVPHRAKSAGTLVVLGADEVLMSDTSELGPIDPQVRILDSSGKPILIPAQSYLDAYSEHAAALNRNANDLAARIMLEKLDPAIRQICLAAKERSRSLAEKLLKQGMFLGESGNWTATASELIDTKRWQTHSQVISWRDANDPPIGLRVQHLDSNDHLWQQHWHLYCLQRLSIQDNQKLFESDYVSLRTE